MYVVRKSYVGSRVTRHRLSENWIFVQHAVDDQPLSPFSDIVAALTTWTKMTRRRLHPLPKTAPSSALLHIMNVNNQNFALLVHQGTHTDS